MNTTHRLLVILAALLAAALVAPPANAAPILDHHGRAWIKVIRCTPAPDYYKGFHCSAVWVHVQGNREIAYKGH